MISFLAVGLVVLATFTGAFGALFLKLGSARIHRNPVSFIRNSKILIGVLLYASSTVLFLSALRMTELSVLYPFAALSYAWATFLSVYYLKEKMNVMKWVGIASIMVGVAIIGLAG
ncbi:EamA family transporter [Candidatus Woesearchaeota archaeon]|nr:EamA family transporter [Candidatus Woesearchaeota archaeon]